MAIYANPAQSGLNKVSSLGDGYTINMRWYQAYPQLFTNKIAYHIYYSTNQEDVFSEGVKYIIIDGNRLGADIIDLTPGQDYWFSLRPVEYDPTIITFLSQLPIAYDNIRYYPSSMLRQNMSATDLIVPLLDVDSFTIPGFVKVGAELIEYTAIDTVNDNLIVPAPGNAGAAYLKLQANGLYYLPGANNVGQGILSSLTLVDSNAPTETWTIRCIEVPDPGIAPPRFETIGNISGNPPYISGNYPVWPVDGYSWQANGYIISNGILSFTINQTSPAFVPGDYFIVQVVGAVPGTPGGRGYNNTLITKHDISGWDGCHKWSPIVSEIIFQEDAGWDQIYSCKSRFEYPNFPFTVLDGYHQVTQDYLSTNLTAADATNVTFPQYDYAGYHRTDPVLLLNGTCVGSYIGGQMGCIDGYGNYNIYRGLSLENQNTQRQDILLSLTGQPCCLIQRMQTGITCSCYLASSEYQDDRCPFCFVGETLVNTETGFRPIEQIKVGDMVLSGDGSYRKVTNTFVHDYQGKLQSLTTTTTTSPILCTPDHNVFKLGGSHKTSGGCGPNSNCKEFIKRGNGGRSRNGVKQLPSGRWHARVQAKNHDRKILGTFDSEAEAQFAIDEYLKEHNIPGHLITLSPASEITKKDWLVNKWYRYTNDLKDIEIPAQFRAKHNKRDIIFSVDEDFCWMVGLYLAEGSSSKRRITFSLHKNEVSYQKKIIAFFNRYGYKATVYKTSQNGAVVEVNSVALARWFPKWLGRGCQNKNIPNELMYLPDNKSLALINGIFDGDGGKRDADLVQTSEILALQVTEILHRLGKQPMVRKIVNKKLTPKGNVRKIAYGVSRERETFIHKNRKGRWQFNENLLTKVKKNEKIDYVGPVYNLEVEGEHSYVVQNVLVKNCYGTKFVFGYVQYFNPRQSDGRIQVRLGPTAETLKMYEAGLESEFPVDMWTLTVPTIKARDIIVTFDQDNNESFRYEVSTVTRNQTILGLDGGQKMTTFRVRKTDPAYQVRIFRDTSDFPQTIYTGLGFAPGLPPHTHAIQTNQNAPSTWSQTTQVSQGHNHPVLIKNNFPVVMEVLGHTHAIILS